MFTVKHIDTDGTERLYVAETVEVVNKGNHFEDGIYLDWPAANNYPANEQEGDAIRSVTRPPAKQVIQFARVRCGTDIPPKVYVMNREGSTVATYNL